MHYAEERLIMGSTEIGKGVHRLWNKNPKGPRLDMEDVQTTILKPSNMKFIFFGLVKSSF